MRSTRSASGKSVVTSPTAGEMQSKPVTLRSVNPVIPKDSETKKLLEEDLATMKLGNLLSLPWNTQSQQMVQELMDRGESTEFKGTVRGRADRWTEKDVGLAFQVPNNGLKMLARGDDRITRYFAGTIDPKEGWTIEQCVDKQLKRVLYFLIPIFRPEKPKRVPVGLGSTIVASLLEGKCVCWASILFDVIKRQIGQLTQKRGVRLAPYLFVFYKYHAVLNTAERLLLSKHESYVRHGIKTEESNPTEDTGSEPDSDIQKSESEEDQLPKRRRLVHKYQVEIDHSLLIPKTEITSAACSPSGSVPGTPQRAHNPMDDLSPDSARDFQGVYTHLGHIVTKIGLLEHQLTTLVAITQSTPQTLVQRVQELVDNASNDKTELISLKAQVAKLAQELKDATAKRTNCGRRGIEKCTNAGEQAAAAVQC